MTLTDSQSPEFCDTGIIFTAKLKWGGPGWCFWFDQVVSQAMAQHVVT